MIQFYGPTHCAPGNTEKSTRRRAIATHWIGDDAFPRVR